MKLFLFVFLFFWSVPVTFAHGPVTVKVGQVAVLPCSLSTKENMETSVFDWKKGGQKVFLYSGGDYYGHGLLGQDKQFEGRVSHFNEELKNGNASIKIRETKMADSGNYTCIFPLLQPRQTFTIELVVECILKDRTKEEPGACREPTVKPLRETNDEALLQCEVKGASPDPKVEWRDSSGNILHAVTGSGGSYDIIIINTTVTKSDTYSCVVTQDAICHQTNSITYVHIYEKLYEDSSVSNWFKGMAVGAAAVAAVLLLILCIQSLWNKGSRKDPGISQSSKGSML